MFITLIRTIILYILVIFAIRVMGKRQIGDMQPGELVITILISEIAAIPIQDLNQPLLTGVVAVFTLVFLEIFISVIVMKFVPLRRIFYGDSAIIIKDGILDQKLLKKLRVTVPDLLEVLRNQQIFDLTQVEYAILETNGQLSVMLKPEFQNATVNDINGKKSNSTMPFLVVSDGHIIKDSLKDASIKLKDVKNELNKRNLQINDIFIMTYDTSGNIQIIRKEN